MDKIRAILFSTTAIAAIAVGGYLSGLFDGLFAPEPQPVTTASAPAAPGTAQDAPAANAGKAADGEMPGKEARLPGKPADADDASDAPSGEATKAPDAAAPAASGATADALAPSFDLLRVEPDGSTLFAGRAAPGASIEIVAGTTVIGRAEAGPGGDFVAVLDEPLSPGDYEIVLRATGSDDIVATSKETAIVSIPDSPDGQVLALVEAPGEASRLITVPEQEESGARAEKAPAAPAQAQTEQKTAAADAAPGAGTMPENGAAPASRDGAASNGTPGATEKPDSDETQQAAGEPQASASASAGGTTNKSDAADARPIAIQAVEIEGRNVYVAGEAQPGRLVRVYANETLLGQSRSSDGGRFLIEAERDLAVGDYIIRADMLADDASSVLARAAVPFAREAGEFVAAVAPESAGAGGKPASEAQMPEAGQPVEDGKAGSAAAPGSAPFGEQGAGTAAPNAPQNGGAADAAPSAGADPEQRPAAAADGQSPVVAAGEPATSPTDMGARLEPVKSAVIIRRGDSLWRISRRVYGRGVRYSTIYMANQDQIENPNRIWPGQVFKVPGETESGEKADMSTLDDQATRVE